MLSAANSEGAGERRHQQREEDEAAPVGPPAPRSGHPPNHRGGPDGGRDPEREHPRLAEDELANGPHVATPDEDGDTGRPPAASARTAACDTSSHAPSTTSSAASPSGQRTPRPSAQKKVPNVVSTSPTTYFSSLSGSRRSGRCSAAPRPTVKPTATREPTSAGASPPGRAA